MNWIKRVFKKLYGVKQNGLLTRQQLENEMNNHLLLAVKCSHNTGLKSIEDSANRKAGKIAEILKSPEYSVKLN